MSVSVSNETAIATTSRQSTKAYGGGTPLDSNFVSTGAAHSFFDFMILLALLDDRPAPLPQLAQPPQSIVRRPDYEDA
jgi:hypothetical protein